MMCRLKVEESKKTNLGFPSIITIAIALSERATDIYISAMPKIAYAFCCAISEIKRTISFYFLTFALGGLFQGPLSDRCLIKPEDNTLS